MDKVKNQHYVPQGYLERFAEGNRVFVFDKTTQKEPFPTNIRNVASSRYFYDISPDLIEPSALPDDYDEQFVEHTLAELDGQLKRQIGKIVTRFTLMPNPDLKEAITYEERADFAVLIAIQYFRTADFRNSMVNASKTIQQMLVDLIGVNEIEGYQLDDVEAVHDPKYEALEHASFMWNKEMLDKISKGFFEDFIWVVGVNETEQPFFTSDNPVVKHGHLDGGIISHQGLLSPGMEIAFPLNSKLILILCKRDSFAELAHYENKFLSWDNPEYITYYNSLQVLQSSKQIYCKEPKFDLVKLMANETPDIMKQREHELEVVSPPFLRKQ